MIRFYKLQTSCPSVVVVKVGKLEGLSFTDANTAEPFALISGLNKMLFIMLYYYLP